MGSSWQHLVYQRDLLLSHALAPNTVNTYRTGVNHYFRFCRRFGIRPMPLSEPVLENFCVSLHWRISAKSIRVYLCGIQLWSTLNGGRVLIEHMLRLDYVLRAIRRVQGNSFARPTRTPITWPLMRTICAYIANTEPPFDREMLLAAVLLAFFGLLRVSEYTSPSPTRADQSGLAVQDVHIDWARRLAFIHIKKSKTDPFRLGVTIRVGVVAHQLCPVTALFRYLQLRGLQPGPLFRYSNGRLLTRINVFELLTRSLPHLPNVNTHSFRRGGATALAAAGVSSDVIRIVGRWKSDAYTRYVQFPDNFFVQANTNMAKME